MNNIDHEKMIGNDSEIIYRFCSLKDLTDGEVIIATFDVSSSLGGRNVDLMCILKEKEELFQKQ